MTLRIGLAMVVAGFALACSSRDARLEAPTPLGRAPEPPETARPAATSVATVRPSATPGRTPTEVFTRVYDARNGALVDSVNATTNSLAANGRGFWVRGDGALELRAFDGTLIEQAAGLWELVAQSPDASNRILRSGGSPEAWLWSAGREPASLGISVGKYKRSIGDAGFSPDGTRFYLVGPGDESSKTLPLSVHMVGSAKTLDVAQVTPCACDGAHPPMFSPCGRYLMYHDYGLQSHGWHLFDIANARISSVPAFTQWHPTDDVYVFTRDGLPWQHDIATGSERLLADIAPVGHPNYRYNAVEFLGGGLFAIWSGTGDPHWGTEIALVRPPGAELGRWQLEQARSYALYALPKLALTVNGYMLSRPVDPKCQGMLLLDTSLNGVRCVLGDGAAVSPDRSQLAVVRGRGCTSRREAPEPIASVIVAVATGDERVLTDGLGALSSAPLLPVWSSDGRYVALVLGSCGA